MKKATSILLIALACGCASTPYYKEVDGTSLLFGVSLPEDGYIQVNALTYLGGSKTIVKEPSYIMHEYEMASTNSYFGVIHTKELRKNKIIVAPTNTMHLSEK